MKILAILRKLQRDTPASVFFTGESAIDFLKRRKSDHLEFMVQDVPLHDIAVYLRKHFPPRSIREGDTKVQVFTDGISASIRSPRGNPYASPKEDALAGGLSILAIYMPIGGPRERCLYFFGADKDLKEHKIHTIGKGISVLKRNPSLMTTIISLAAKYNYKPDGNLIHAMRKVSHLIQTLPAGIVRSALTDVMLSRKPSKFLRLMQTCGILEEVMPELTACIGIAQQARYHKYDVFDHCLAACDATPKRLDLRFAALFHDVGKAPTRAYMVKDGANTITFYNHEVAGAKIALAVLRRLDYPKPLITEVNELVYHHMYNYVSDKWSDAAVSRFIERAGITREDLKDLSNHPLFLLRKADRAASGRIDIHKLSGAQIALERKIHEKFDQESKLSITDLAVNGTALMEIFHLQEGPTVGHVLKHLFAKILENPELNSKEILIEEASKYLSAALK
jgi:tRNA nucleotidyltransferase (CCA-adding enzyme)